MSLLSREERAEFVRRMQAAYPDAKCALDHKSNFQLLVAVVLSAQTTDVGVNKATPALFAAAPDAFAMAALTEEQIADYIKTIGMYRTKSHNVHALSCLLVQKYGGEVPGDFDALAALPGVGRKTANVVLAECFGKQTIAVDTHVFRLAGRIGLAEEPDVLKTEQALMKALPQSCWTQMHHAIIWHGRLVCSARKPACSGCCLEGLCKRNGL